MVTMADTGLLAAPAAAAATARHSKARTPPLGVYSSTEDTDSDAEADRTRDEEEDEDRLRHHQQQQQQQQPVCLAARSNNNNNNINDSDNSSGKNNSIVNNNNNSINNSTRNKRKNFQPRNISYALESAEDSRGENGTGGGDPAESADSTAAAAAAAVLDLSSCTGSTVAKRPRVDDGSAPMDLTCAVQAPSPVAAVDKWTSSSAQSVHGVPGVQHILQAAAAAAAAAAGGHHHPLHNLHHQQNPNQPHEATDLKEYAQNTVRELLEIYGLNTDVADAITNNVPMVNFSTGKCFFFLNSFTKYNYKVILAMHSWYVITSHILYFIVEMKN